MPSGTVLETLDSIDTDLLDRLAGIFDGKWRKQDWSGKWRKQDLVDRKRTNNC